MFFAGEAAPSAGGAALDEVLIVSVFTFLVYGVVGWVILRERAGKATLLGRVADVAARIDGGPRWFVLPTLISVGGALAAATGVYWDVSLHIEDGRDTGPLANPAHYFIFLGLMLIFTGGALGMALKDERMPRRTLRLSRNWSAPLGASLGTVIAMLALGGFPLDDVWHRLFGQDVTEWGPTHIIMIGGTIMLPYALLLSSAEARQVGGSKLAAFWEYIGVVVLMVGPVAFLLEYMYGVPQNPLIMDVVLVTMGVVVGLSYAMYKGPLYVIAAWAGYAGVQWALQGVNVFIWQAMTPEHPLLLGGAVAAAVLAKWAKPTVAFAAGAGVVIALANLAVDYYWSKSFRPMEWPEHMMGWAALTAVVVGAAVGLIATWMFIKLSIVAATTEEDAAFARITSRTKVSATGPVGGAVAALGLLAVIGVFAVHVAPKTEGVGEADVTIGQVSDGRAPVEIAVSDGLVEDAYWFECMSWQGGGQIRSQVERIGVNQYRCEDPMPVTGSWKTLVRLQMPVHVEVALPIYMPADEAVPVEAYEAVSGPRPFQKEKDILQREVKKGVNTGLWTVAYLVVAIVFSGLFVAVAVGYSAAGRPGRGELRPTLRRNRELTGSDA